MTPSVTPPSSESAETPQPAAAAASSAEPRRPSARAVLMMVVPLLVVLITFLFWYQTWFGRPLDDAEMAESLAATSAPHKIQHALVQLGERMARGDASARRWSPQILALASSPEPQLRSMAAWAMGQDNRSEEFHQALRKLVEDPQPLVRWNAALALVRFDDAAGRPQLLEMLQPYALRTPQAGTLKFRLKEQDAVRGGSIVARLDVGKGAKAVDVVSPVPGTLAQLLARNEAPVAAGNAVARIAPGEKQVWESLRALYLVGQTEDLEDVERFARGATDMSARVQAQAQLTAQAIRERAMKEKKPATLGGSKTGT